jgi:hypothetical protein
VENGAELRRRLLQTNQKDNSINNANPNKTDLYMTQNNKETGKTILSGGYLNTRDSFWFALADDITVKPFDFITFDRSHNIKTIGMIQDPQTISTLCHHSFEHPSSRGQHLVGIIICSLQYHR